jgi:alpha-glucosidase
MLGNPNIKMKKQYTLFPTLAIFVIGFWGTAMPCDAATTPAPPTEKARSSQPVFLVLRTVTGSKPIGNGIEIRSESAVMQVTALQDDVLRVRVGPRGQLPEDASWAVLAAARTASVRVSAEEDAASVGFRTNTLRVKVDRATMRLRVTDLNGTLIQEDAAGRPIEFHGSAFRLYKTMAADEHYFGLGDKPGSLDRRDHAYSLWNTDSLGFQESTDPIYKSIPFFLTSRGGTTAGVLLDNTWRTSFDFGKESPDVYSFGSEGGPLDYYILYGPDAKHVLSMYAWLTGPTPLPPLWSLGFQQSRFSYQPESEVRKVADQ